MLFYYFMLGSSMLIPIMMYIFGALFRKRPPKNTNDFYGYRTKRSRMNQDTWDYAHKYVGNLWSKGSLILLALSLFPYIFLTDKSKDILGITTVVIICIQGIIVSLTFIPAEKAMKHRFDHEGNKIEHDKDDVI